MKAANVFIVGAKRTAFGTYGGKLKNFSPTDLGEFAARAALKHASINPENVDHVIFGNVIQSSQDSAYLARHIGLRIGLPINTPAVTVNRLCGSGFEAIIQACHVFQGRRTISTSVLWRAAHQPFTLKTVEDRIILVLSLYDKINADKLTLDSHFFNDLGLDSLDFVEVIIAIEDEFMFEIPDGDSDRFNTPRDIFQYICDKMDVYE